MNQARLRPIVTLAALSCALFALIAGSFAGPAQAAAVGSFTAHQIKVQPRFAAVTHRPSVTTQDCLTALQILCYSPQQIRRAYDIQPLLNEGIAGKGRTIVIIDAYTSPTIRADLKAFDQAFGLPEPKSFRIVQPQGHITFDPNDPNEGGWAAEITLDVEWSHAIAPDAKIVLVESKTNNDTDILAATDYAVNYNLGDVISQSFGEGEACADPKLLQREHQVFADATHKGITIFASSGDSGAGQPACDGSNSLFLSASTPASDPLVTAVGGTSLFANVTTGAYQHESAWNGSGGGFSSIYAKPSYQNGVPGIGAMRGVPDVASLADPSTGVLVYWTPSPVFHASAGFWIFGGTSAGSPVWAGLIALGDQLAGRRLGAINPALYFIGKSSSLYHSAFHDITTGDNIQPGIGGYSTGKGWDPVTGWGTPKAALLLPLLATYAKP